MIRNFFQGCHISQRHWRDLGRLCEQNRPLDRGTDVLRFGLGIEIRLINAPTRTFFELLRSLLRRILLRKGERDDAKDKLQRVRSNQETLELLRLYLFSFARERVLDHLLRNNTDQPGRVLGSRRVHVLQRLRGLGHLSGKAWILQRFSKHRNIGKAWQAL